MTFYNKYLKYKNKYLEAKNEYDNLTNNCKTCNNKSCNCLQQYGGINNTLYLFKADWCGHCKNFMPIWKDLQKSVGNKINFNTFDADKNKNEIKEFNIQGFPTLILIKNNTKIEYEGERDVKSITDFINSYVN